MPSPVIFSMTATQARALIDLYEGSGAVLRGSVGVALFAQGLIEQNGRAIALTPVGYHAAQLALALPTPWAEGDAPPEQASLLLT